MKTLLKTLSILILVALATGFYFKFQNDPVLGDRIIGISVLVSSFILLPLWLYHSWKGKHLKDYTFTDENIKKMRDKADERNKKNNF